MTGSARLLRLLSKLKATQTDRHAQLLLSVARAAPAMAADYLNSCSSNVLELTASSSHWFVGMTLTGQLVQAASQGSDPILELVTK